MPVVACVMLAVAGGSSPALRSHIRPTPRVSPSLCPSGRMALLTTISHSNFISKGHAWPTDVKWIRSTLQTPHSIGSKPQAAPTRPCMNSLANWVLSTRYSMPTICPLTTGNGWHSSYPTGALGLDLDFEIFLGRTAICYR